MRAPICAFALPLFATGCFGGKGVVTVDGAGTHIVRGPGAVTVIHDGRSCTMQTAAGQPLAPGHGKVGEKGDKPHGHHARPRPEGRGNPLDTVMFRLCEARSNGDITEAQYTDAVAKLLETMGQMAKHRAAGHAGPRGRRGEARHGGGRGMGRGGKGGHRGRGEHRGRGGRGGRGGPGADRGDRPKGPTTPDTGKP